ncbi:MAG TPA: sigma-70 family RNA polymerase sigma factor [Terriglobales bacterium]|nr:sigma-70 family RNA polymerase sigma factor [Terriglobales bacterium]
MAKEPESGPGETPQLFDGKRVSSGVSSVALQRQAMGAAARQEEAGDGFLGGPLDLLSDAQVMLRVAAGDDAAFDYLVEKFRRPLIGFMYRMVRSQAIAEELAQEAFLRVYRSRKSYRAEARFTTWLYRIATNLAVNHARDMRSKRAQATTSLDEPPPEGSAPLDVADAAPTAEQLLLARERREAIRQRVEALPERQRLAVLMHKYQGMDYREIGEVLKLSESATKSLLFRAYESLRESLKEFL